MTGDLFCTVCSGYLANHKDGKPCVWKQDPVTHEWPRHPKAHRLSYCNLLCNFHAVPMIAGQAFTEYKCVDCQTDKLWHNTNTPKRCPECSMKNKKCLDCDAVMPENGFGQVVFDECFSLDSAGKV